MNKKTAVEIQMEIFDIYKRENIEPLYAIEHMVNMAFTQTIGLLNHFHEKKDACEYFNVFSEKINVALDVFKEELINKYDDKE